ncbi:MAG: alpha-hydroxy-acid oxidizing protein [Zoogloeaceae bacterium]|nr:alpha-hydroxy-acid oxidizing protein [Rhodocyclaceae bacterium]MCP5231673.1 alpha-hydroxy-acid oxidizing protein [Zoogloeaceae bacterium]MCP5239986.1 alpha-hydroxy-acid oxidizing protein [Zoogloeaceae bacterium]MCP5253785.1 alpha-hydroxy-acid oxidizing protein [Zoogloeaceae bacterium]MCP5293825.1 alpha-hydroxy-acid oxidizing protein [Zoogloeaceae bacterium]
MSAPEPERLPPGLVSLADHEALARTRLDANALAYFEGGAGDEHTLGANREAWNEIALYPRILRRLAAGSTRTTLLGRSLAHPILLAPVAFQRLAHADGELACAHAAAAQGAGMVVSTQASISLERIASAIADDPERGPLWFQLYLQHDRGFNRELLARVEAAAYEALVLTVDAPCSGARDRERRAGFSLPPGISAVNLAALPPRPRTGGSGLCGGLMELAPDWDELAWLQQNTRLPILLKGILRPDDARLAADAGVAGLIVSNHGGRVLDTAVATARALPAIAEAIGHRLPLLVDGGIRRGTDVLKAIALGADAVLVGRPAIHGLACAGALGVAHVLRLLRDELEIAMALCGCARIEDITRDVLDRGEGQRRHT